MMNLQLRLPCSMVAAMHSAAPKRVSAAGDNHHLLVRELCDSELREFPPVPGPLHAAEWKPAVAECVLIQTEPVSMRDAKAFARSISAEKIAPDRPKCESLARSTIASSSGRT